MIVIKTLLKSGGCYKPEHVERMRYQISKHVNCPYKFVCYTDKFFEIDDELRPLGHDWPKWWSKIEIFKEFEDSFYIDLDMTIEGDITDMVSHPSHFMALRNMSPNIPGIGSAMMRWNSDLRFLYNKFKESPNEIMARHNKMGTQNWGDQGYIWEEMIGKTEFYQHTFPRRIRRFSDPAGGDVRVYFGRTKPWGIVKR